MGRASRRKHARHAGSKKRKPTKCQHCARYFRKSRLQEWQYCGRVACRAEAEERAKVRESLQRLSSYDAYTLSRSTMKAINFGLAYGAGPGVLRVLADRMRNSIRDAIDEKFIHELINVGSSLEDSAETITARYLAHARKTK